MEGSAKSQIDLFCYVCTLTVTREKTGQNYRKEDVIYIIIENIKVRIKENFTITSAVLCYNI